jgi:uncharacterized protein (TIGR03032 family)
LDRRETIWTAAKSILWRFENDLAPGALSESGADRLFVPCEGRETGQIDIHDIGIGDTGDGSSRPIFVATGYNCLATISDRGSFRPIWQPPFISAFLAEDRCHLNGLTMEDNRPAFVSAVSRSDVADGWRERRQDGGVIVDVAGGDIVASGLSMPHSPRIRDGISGKGRAPIR